MSEPPDIGPVAWKIWDAMVNKNGLPLVVLESDLVEITEHEAAILERIGFRGGLTITYDPIARSQTIHEHRPK